MKTLNVPKISLSTQVQAKDIPTLLTQNNVLFETVDNVNWKEDYPYQPTMKFRIAHTGDNILIQYVINEKTVRAVAPSDNGRVWEDSCAEFFAQPDETSGMYYNFECNCAGTLLIEYGKPGDREHAPLDVVHSVERWASLGRLPFEEKDAPTEWTLCLVIPASAFFHDNITSLNGKEMRANFYKCGDLLQTPHFISWNPIDLPTPCFHCPQFFGKIYFEK